MKTLLEEFISWLEKQDPKDTYVFGYSKCITNKFFEDRHGVSGIRINRCRNNRPHYYAHIPGEKKIYSYIRGRNAYLYKLVCSDLAFKKNSLYKVEDVMKAVKEKDGSIWE